MTTIGEGFAVMPLSYLSRAAPDREGALLMEKMP